MAGSEQNTASCLAYPDDMAGSWGAENAVLADQELLDAVCCTDLGDELCDFGVPVASISADDQEGALYTLRDRLEDAGDERLCIVVLLEDFDLLS